MDDGKQGEPLYDLDTREWSHYCPCIRQMQVDPECEWHGDGRANH